MTEHKGKNMLSDLKIQEALTEQDLGTVYPVIYQLRDQLSFNTFLDRIIQARQGNYRLFSAHLGKRVVGVIGLRIQDDLCWGHNLYIDDLVVEQTLQGKGIGQALMKFAENLARSEKCQYVRLASGISKTKAHEFYERLGYHQTSFAFALKIIC